MTTPLAAGLPSSLDLPSARQTIIRVEGLTKRFPRRRSWREAVRHPLARDYATTVNGATFEVKEGEFFGLLGPNGAGKTTIFKMLATLVAPDDGWATVGGYDVVDEGARVRELIAPVIADERSLYWRLSARENLEIFARLFGLRGAARQRRVNELLEIVQLADASNKLVGMFSAGMKQRLLIARALLPNPRVLLLDEPTRSLDPISARTFRTFLRDELSRAQGCTILLATHNTEEAIHLCERVVVLDRGEVLADGSASVLAEERGDDRYRLWTRHADHPSLAALAERGVIANVRLAAGDDDTWQVVELDAPGGTDGAARVVDMLTCAGVSIARFERVPLSLADLIQRVIDKARRDRAGVAA